MTDPALTPERLEQHSLKPEDYAHLASILGIEPAPAEVCGAASLNAGVSAEPVAGSSAPSFQLADIPEPADYIGALKTLLAHRDTRLQDWLAQLPETGRASVVDSNQDTALLRIVSASPEFAASSAETIAAASNESAKPETVAAKVVLVTVGGKTDAPHPSRESGTVAVAEAARTLACAGAAPLCLIHDRPSEPGQLPVWREFLSGATEGCCAFRTVCLTRKSPPAANSSLVAMLGSLPNPDGRMQPGFKDEGDAIILLGDLVDRDDPLLGLGGSAYLRHVSGKQAGAPSRCNLEKERDLHLGLRAILRSDVVKSACICGQGGLAATLARCCLAAPGAAEAPKGAQIDLGPAISGTEAGEQPPAPAANPPRLDALLFGESQTRIVITVARVNAAKVLAQAKILEIPALRLGNVGGSTLQIAAAGKEFTWNLSDLSSV